MSLTLIFVVNAIFLAKHAQVHQHVPIVIVLNKEYTVVLIAIVKLNTTVQAL